VFQTLADGIGCSLKPGLGAWCLLGSQNPNEALIKRIESIGPVDMPVERLTVKLRQDINISDTAIDAVRYRDIN